MHERCDVEPEHGFMKGSSCLNMCGNVLVKLDETIGRGRKWINSRRIEAGEAAGVLIYS
jgi:hypothetical protein